MKVEKRPIRVAQMMTEMNYGGVEMVVMNYYRHIDHSKVQFDFFVLEGSEIPQRKEIEELGGRIYIVPHYKHLLQYEKTLIHLFKENQYKIVHSHMNTLSVFSLRAAKHAGVPVRIAHNHSTAGKGEYKKNFVKYILRLWAKIYPTDLFACSKKAGEWIYGKNTEFTIFSNSIALEKFLYNEKIRNKIKKEYNIQNKFVIGHVGRFCYQKNHEFLIDIFSKVYKEDQDVVLLLIGEGELENNIKEKVHVMELDQCVIFAGACENVNEMYQAMDIFVLPSRYEGLPVVGVEAQAAGLPCLFSENVTREAKILENTQFIGKNEKDWISKILSMKKVRREKTDLYLSQAGFNIVQSAKKLERFYLEKCEEVELNERG